MSAREKQRIGSDALKAVFRWDVIGRAFSAALKKDTWARLFSAEAVSEFFGRDLISALHLAGVIAVVTICIVSYRSVGGGGRVAVIGAFAYFNVFVGIVVARNIDAMDTAKAIWGVVKLWVMAVGVGIILASMWNGWGALLNASTSVGIFAVPVMIFDSEMRRRVVMPFVHTAFGSIESAFSGNSIESVGGGLIGALIVIVIGLVMVLVAGAIVVVCHYIGLAAELCIVTGCRFAKPKEALQLAEGVVAEDMPQPMLSEAAAPQPEAAHDREESQPQEEDDDEINLDEE